MAGATRGGGGGRWMVGPGSVRDWVRSAWLKPCRARLWQNTHHQRLPMSMVSRLKQRIENIRKTGNAVPAALDMELKRLQKRATPASGKGRQKKRPKKRSFYQSREWKELRYKILVKYGARCQCCGATAKDGAKINVDHIEPISKKWERRLDETNLQVLCGACNLGKGAHDTTDWRALFDLDATDRI